MYVFNSRDKDYKSIISAIKTDEKVKLRIVVPRNMKCCGAFLAVQKDTEDTVYYSMFWAGMCGSEHERGHQRAAGTAGGRAPAGYGDGQ